MSFLSMSRGIWRFFLHWLKKPRRIGAVVPSGGTLAAAMAGYIDVQAPGTVIELGGGTGCITDAILRAGVAPENLIIVEREPEFCELIASRFPDVNVLCADARDLTAILRRTSVRPVKAIVSSLPLLTIKDAECRQILESAFSVLAHEGEFLQFTYGPSMPISRNIRDALDIEGIRSEWILSNIPPAAVWRFWRKDVVVDNRRAA